jgi:hypothetical protein
MSSRYSQPGLLGTPQNFAQSSKFLGEKIFFGTKVTSEAFLSISQDMKVTPLQGGTQTKLWTCSRNFDVSRSFERFFGACLKLRCAPVDGLNKNVVNIQRFFTGEPWPWRP